MSDLMLGRFSEDMQVKQIPSAIRDVDGKLLVPCRVWSDKSLCSRCASVPATTVREARPAQV